MSEDYRKSFPSRLSRWVFTVIAAAMAVAAVTFWTRGKVIETLVFGAFALGALVVRWLTRFEPWD